MSSGSTLEPQPSSCSRVPVSNRGTTGLSPDAAQRHPHGMPGMPGNASRSNSTRCQVACISTCAHAFRCRAAPCLLVAATKSAAAAAAAGARILHWAQQTDGTPGEASAVTYRPRSNNDAVNSSAPELQGQLQATLYISMVIHPVHPRCEQQATLRADLHPRQPPPHRPTHRNSLQWSSEPASGLKRWC